MTNTYDILKDIDFPQDLRKLEEDKLPQLAQQLRDYLIEVISQTGGHLAPGLGTVELTVALHYIFNTPYDRLVWDIGHQAYPHKILTGRRDLLPGIRQPGGISGFLKRSESEYDSFGAGHSSTSISAALGMAASAKLKKEDRDVVAIIGDGALTAGMAFEALNNAGDMDSDILVVLNDNEMSISPNVGAISNYLARILSGNAYMSARENSKSVLSTLPPIKTLAKKWEEHMKGMVMPSTLFEELGFYYIGPVDGHDLKTLCKTLKNMKEMKGPRFLHVVTQKGKGFKSAEDNPCVFHGVSPFNKDTGKLEKQASTGKSYTNIFSDWLCDMAEKDSKLVGITPAMREGSGLVEFSEKFPDRYFDVGIAEQHALTFAAGMACEGYKPVVAIYSTFLQRAYDQLIHDISIQDLDITLAIDRAGLVGADGATHAGVFDYSFLRCVPHMVIMAPADEQECRDMLYTAYEHKGCASVRYPRGGGPGVECTQAMNLIPLGSAEIKRHSSLPLADTKPLIYSPRVAILSFGSVLEEAIIAAEKIDATVVNMRFVKPLDTATIDAICAEHDVIITIEENMVAGGAGSGVNEYLIAKQSKSNEFTLPRIFNLGLPDTHIDHGDVKVMRNQAGIDSEAIINIVNGIKSHAMKANESNEMNVNSTKTMGKLGVKSG